MEADAILGEERITCGMLHGIPIELETTRKQRKRQNTTTQPQQQQPAKHSLYIPYKCHIYSLNMFHVFFLVCFLIYN